MVYIIDRKHEKEIKQRIREDLKYMINCVDDKRMNRFTKIITLCKEYKVYFDEINLDTFKKHFDKIILSSMEKCDYKVKIDLVLAEILLNETKFYYK
ncbi:hypothetical protein [Helicovermis profundi]|uniref:Uncharacterized protein n=1 Tax=Helicovermis profundi TaxID=3065157 RepID=A0AAU9E4W4_9FIRM|nr:hypothetical protein HLPR_20120 [Clostridia bacterium S502]